jgi:hypothetical protein
MKGFLVSNQNFNETNMQLFDYREVCYELKLKFWLRISARKSGGGRLASLSR